MAQRAKLQIPDAAEHHKAPIYLQSFAPVIGDCRGKNLYGARVCSAILSRGQSEGK